MPRLPDGYEVPEGFVLVTSRSWHGTQHALRAVVVACVLIVGAVVALQLQVSSRNRNIDQVTAAANAAKVSADAGTAALKQAIAQSGGSSDLSTRSAVAVEQIGAICLRVVSPAECARIDAAVRAEVAARSQKRGG